MNDGTAKQEVSRRTPQDDQEREYGISEITFDPFGVFTGIVEAFNAQDTGNEPRLGRRS
jgi:hypothetical protein